MGPSVVMRCGGVPQRLSSALLRQHAPLKQFRHPSLFSSSRSNSRLSAAQPSSSGDYPPNPPSGGGGGGGGSGDGAGSDGEGDREDKGGWGWQGWRDRVAADPEFPFKVFIEQLIGVGAGVIGDMASRPNWGLDELDFVFSTIVVGSMMNFSLMYLLAPVLGASAQPTILRRLFSEHYLVRWGAPTGHMFERGFPLSGRLVNLGYKGALFASIGLSAGVVGTATSNLLLQLRRNTDPTFQTQNAAPDVAKNAAVWATHMGVSSNLRYQLLNGMDMVLSKHLPSPVFKAFTGVIRTGNNVVGGMSFVTLAKAFKVQEAAVKEELPAAA